MNGDKGRSIAMPPPAFCGRPDREIFDESIGLTGLRFSLAIRQWRPIRAAST
jgi:hypothetical protein